MDGLRTERLTLRRFTVADVDLLVALDADPEVMRYLTGGASTPRTVIEAEVLPSILATYAERPGLGRWATLATETGVFIGWLALQPTAQVDEAELGYRLKRDAWGRGYASEGCSALIGHAFELGMMRVFAQTMAVNIASRAVMARCGMRHVRDFHLAWENPIAGAEQGEVEYEILAPQWKSQCSTPS